MDKKTKSRCTKKFNNLAITRFAAQLLNYLLESVRFVEKPFYVARSPSTGYHFAVNNKYYNVVVRDNRIRVWHRDRTGNMSFMVVCDSISRDIMTP